MNPGTSDHTIAAISTPLGAGGIGIIRISGREALPILKKIFKPSDTHCSFHSHQLYYGHIHQAGEGKVLDEVLAVYMAAPRTYTREDVVEIHCHGSLLVLQNVLETVLQRGASLARPGEFTKRAFLNGRIDLTRAEAVIDILAARTRKGVDLAQEQLAGNLYSRIDLIRGKLATAKAFVEVAIDFPDEDVEIIDHTEITASLRLEVLEPLRRLLKVADHGKIFREGVSLVIVGLPNVGKSSLLNTILQEERALVTAVPGTTRDSIEEVVDIHGMPVRIIDTAGIREGADAVELLGIKRARDLINSADLVLFIVDGSRPISEDDRSLYSQVSHKPVLPVVNKIDLGCEQGLDLSLFDDELEVVKISAKHQTNIDALKEAVFARFAHPGDQWEEEGCVPNLRHKKALEAAAKACERLIESLESGFTFDLIAVDLQECLDQLAEIVGETTTEDILDIIFEQFCIGK